ncbi:hypothetical protein K0M31_006384, partial [Melipona bicolor]
LFHPRQVKKCSEKLYETNEAEEELPSTENYGKKLNKPQERKKRCYRFTVILKETREDYEILQHLQSNVPLNDRQRRQRLVVRRVEGERSRDLVWTRDKILRDGAGTISFSATIRRATPVYTVKKLGNARRVVSSRSIAFSFTVSSGIPSTSPSIPLHPVLTDGLTSTIKVPFSSGGNFRIRSTGQSKNKKTARLVPQ